MNRQPDMRRRRMLKRLGLAATFVYAAPVMLQLSSARASDSFSGASAPSGPSYAAPQQPPVQRRAAVQPSLPELLIAVNHPQDFAVLEGAGFRLLGAESVGLVGLWLGRFGLPQGLNLENARNEALRLLPGARVESNALYRTSELLCSVGSCAAHDMVGWPQPEPCGATPVIGMIDAGINPQHEAFTGQALEMLDLDIGERNRAGATHGTAVAALLIGRIDSRTPGLLPNARLVAVNAFHTDSLGEAADAFSVVRALDRLAAANVDVINMSFAGPATPLLEEAIEAVRMRGIPLVAAAGNDGPFADPLFPAAYESVVGVTAVDRSQQVYRQAATGDHIDFAAPGVRLWTAASISGGRLRSGTSYATPFVTAALAVARHGAPDDPVESLVETLASRAEDLGEPGFDSTFGWGLLRADDLCLLPA